MLKEVCVENFTKIPKAIQQGTDRIELCDNLAVGGTTVSLGVMEQAIAYCKTKAVPVMAIIRPRGGNFVYDDIEKAIMLRDIQLAQHAGVHGIVIGALTEKKELDKDFLRQVVKYGGSMEKTFHMAFDEIAEDFQQKTIDWLCDAGFSRILTHGGPLTTPIEEHFVKLREGINYAGDRIIILPGGGITQDNLEEIQQELAVQEVHGTKVVGIL
ncbi:copper homeostasis protein CutC [Desemzia sp. FAM 24101]|uniref:copper homeostasis protein CutC n=1 Tax=unclassified Desemzia TaxID=2685243 RepID=UPI00388676DB